MSVNLETPFALSAFLANNANFQKVYIPATYNMTKILESLSIQQSSHLICDNELFELEVPSKKQNELQEQTKSVTHSVVASNGGKLGRSQLF
jgi:hypothetical protein